MAPDLVQPRSKKRRGSSMSDSCTYRDGPSRLNVPSTTPGIDQRVLKSFADRDEVLRAITTCKICFRPLYEPFTNECGHTYCYSCLCQWFSNINGTKKTCPDCRAIISRPPAPAYALREITRELLQRPELLPQEEIDVHAKWQSDEAAAVEKDKSNANPDTGGLFKGCFRQLPSRPFRLAPLLDAEDGVMRCPECAWELEGDHQSCGNCGYEFESDDGNSWDSDDEAEGIGSEDELDDDISLEDLDFSESMHSESTASSRSLGSRSASSVDHGFDPVRLSNASRSHRGNENQRSFSESSQSPGFEEESADESNDNNEDETDDLDYNYGDDKSGDHRDDDDDDNDDDRSSIDSFIIDDDVLDEEDEPGSESSSATTRQLRTSPASRRLRYTIIDSDDESSQNSPSGHPTRKPYEVSSSESSRESHANNPRRSPSSQTSESFTRPSFSPKTTSSGSNSIRQISYDRSLEAKSTPTGVGMLGGFSASMRIPP